MDFEEDFDDGDYKVELDLVCVGLKAYKVAAHLCETGHDEQIENEEGLTQCNDCGFVADPALDANSAAPDFIPLDWP